MRTPTASTNRKSSIGGARFDRPRKRSDGMGNRFTAMRRFFAAGVTLFVLTLACNASVDISGTWMVDLKALGSADAIMTRLGVPGIQRKLAASIKLEATYEQSKHHLTVRTRGPAFSRVEQPGSASARAV